jgi:hypothetical protein
MNLHLVVSVVNEIDWNYLMMACCEVLESSVVCNCRTGGGAGDHSFCKNVSAARK